jgi:hypothetical protein
MGKVYRHPDRPWSFLTIHDADPTLEAPPEPSVGEIVGVDMEYAYVFGDDSSWIRCQQCDTSICRTEVHVRAHGVRKNAIGWAHKYPHFCDRECWAGWASRATE